MLTLKEWDDISSKLEHEVMPDGIGEKQKQYMWAVFGRLLTQIKGENLPIDKVLLFCEEKVLNKKKGLSKK